MQQKPIKIMEREWDYLIILDACRYDMFKKYNILNGTLDKQYSSGSATEDWSINNFVQYYNDVIYITSNPLTSIFFLKKHIGFNPFFKVDEVWDYGWDQDLRGVYPKEVTKAVLRNLKEFPNKRLLIHYLQPHYPFILSPETQIGRGMYKEYIQSKEGYITKERLESLGGVPYHYLDILSPMQLREGYIKNLILILKEIKYNLLPYLPKDSKIIISSDHGELLGYPEDNGRWGHAKHRTDTKLLEIPWFIVNVEKTLNNLN